MLFELGATAARWEAPIFESNLKQKSIAKRMIKIFYNLRWSIPILGGGEVPGQVCQSAGTFFEQSDPVSQGKWPSTKKDEDSHKGYYCWCGGWWLGVAAIQIVVH